MSAQHGHRRIFGIGGSAVVGMDTLRGYTMFVLESVPTLPVQVEGKDWGLGHVLFCAGSRCDPGVEVKVRMGGCLT